MDRFSIQHIITLTGGTLAHSGNLDAPVEHLLTDSRRLTDPSSTLFFAIDGLTRKADGYAMELYRRGVRSFVLKRDFPKILLAKLNDAAVILVDDVVMALQQIAGAWRQAFTYPVVGITGSNGKTIVKEWLFQLLNDQFQVVRSPKSYNSQIGVPLSVWLMNSRHNLAIYEAGISKPGEMERLEKVISPDLGILCFMGEAHSETFPDFKSKIREKLNLFKHSKALVYCEDDPIVVEEVNRFKTTLHSSIELLGWSRTHTAWVSVHHIEEKGSGLLISGNVRNEHFEFLLPFTDHASVFNAITAYTAATYLRIPIAKLATAIAQLQPVEMRLELLAGINNCSIINDSYSADLNSLEIALDFLMQQQQHPNRTVILSDLLQSGIDPSALYRRIASLLETKGLHRLIGIGKEMNAHQQAFININNVEFYSDTDEFIRALPSLHFRNETILLKGARVFEFERISRLLQQRIHETVLEIDLNALRDNLKTFQSFLKPGVKMMAMVKAFSYGSGSFEIANVLQHEGVDYLAVAYTDEGVELRKAGIRLPIMVMNPEYDSFYNIVNHELEPEIYSFSLLKAFNHFLETSDRTNYPVHIKTDTGMHRLGFMEDEVEKLSNWLKGNVNIHVVSVFSHLAASDDPQHDAFTREQYEKLLRFTNRIKQTTGYSFITHLSNSSAIHRHRDKQLDMVRLGIGMYGVDREVKLKNVTTLKTTVSQIKKVKAGESVGYNRAAMLTRDAEIATVRIGYADGYPRLLGNGNGKMLINGKRYPVIGNICMDMLMLDVTGGNVKEEDEVIVFGASLPVSELASWAQTIPYEILTNISQRVKRLYYEE